MSRSPVAPVAWLVALLVAACVASGVGVTVPEPAGVSPRGRSEGPATLRHSSFATYGSEQNVLKKSRKKLRHGALS